MGGRDMIDIFVKLKRSNRGIFFFSEKQGECLCGFPSSSMCAAREKLMSGILAAAAAAAAAAAR